MKFSLDRVLDPAAKSPTLSYISTIAGVDVVDDLTVRIRHGRAGPAAADADEPLPRLHRAAGLSCSGSGRSSSRAKPSAPGPMHVTEFVPDDHVTMQANPGYWRGKPAIDTVVWRAIPEPTARVAALLAGEVQLVEGVPVDLAPTLAGDKDVQVVKVRNGGLIIYLGLKTAEKPLDDVRVRQALSLAIDRRTIVQELLKGFATTTGTQVGPVRLRLQGGAGARLRPGACQGAAGGGRLPRRLHHPHAGAAPLRQAAPRSAR